MEITLNIKCDNCGKESKMSHIDTTGEFSLFLMNAIESQTIFECNYESPSSFSLMCDCKEKQGVYIQL